MPLWVGAVVAARLSEDPSASVLVVEAGGAVEWSPFAKTKVPAACAELQKDPVAWEYHTTYAY